MLGMFRQNDITLLLYGVKNVPNIGVSFKRITLYLSACLYSPVCREEIQLFTHTAQFQTNSNKHIAFMY
jgi:hypothetical protein